MLKRKIVMKEEIYKEIIHITKVAMTIILQRIIILDLTAIIMGIIIEIMLFKKITIILPKMEITKTIPFATVSKRVKYLGINQGETLTQRELEHVVVVVQSLSRVWLFATPWTAAPPGSSAHGISQARVL